MKTRFTQAAIDRQTALDYIIANPGAYAPDIVAAMGLQDAKSVGALRLSNMVANGEVSRKSVTIEIINKNGHKAKLNTYAYTALTSKTRSEADTKKRLTENLGGTKTVVAQPVIQPWVRDPDRKPIRNQGGQGAVRHEVRRGCSLS